MKKLLVSVAAVAMSCAGCNGQPPATSAASSASAISSASADPAAPAATSGTAAQPASNGSFEIHPIEVPTQFAQASGQTVLKEALALIRVPEARNQFSVAGAGLTAAVLDTGLRTTHVDFRGRVAAQRNFTTDNNGAVDNASDGEGHGTNVAGIIAASEAPPAAGAPKGEHTGAAPKARIIPLKVLTNNGKGNFAWVQSALTWVLENAQQFQISVVNLSLGDGTNRTSDTDLTNDTLRSLIEQLRAKRIAVVLAAGNDYFKYKTQGMAYPAIIAATTSVGAVYDANVGPMHYVSQAIATSTDKDQVTPFSQRFHESASAKLRTDVFAPGATITSTGIANDRGESVQQGTSQAAPMIAGVILLLQEYYLREKHELPAVDDVEKWLREGAVTIQDDCSNCDNVPHTRLRFPRVDALGALLAAKKTIQAPQ